MLPSVVSPEIRNLLEVLERAETMREKENTVREIVKRIIVRPPETLVVDIVLTYCAEEPQLFELGTAIVMIASEHARNNFRAKLISSGAFLLAIQLANGTNYPLSRVEMVTLGNKLTRAITKEEAVIVLRYAKQDAQGVLAMDLRRLEKQLKKKTP